jgi:alkylhydroperoxidase family enzyme
LLAHVERLTLAPASTTRADLDTLRANGFDDTAILQLTAIAGFFAYVNRLADGLGVGRP